MKKQSTRRAIYNFIKSHIADKGYGPTYDEIKTACNLKSRSSVDYHLQFLKQKELIYVKFNSPRSIRIKEPN